MGCDKSRARETPGPRAPLPAPAVGPSRSQRWREPEPVHPRGSGPGRRPAPSNGPSGWPHVMIVPLHSPPHTRIVAQWHTNTPLPPATEAKPAARAPTSARTAGFQNQPTINAQMGDSSPNPNLPVHQSTNPQSPLTPQTAHARQAAGTASPGLPGQRSPRPRNAGRSGCGRSWPGRPRSSRAHNRRCFRPGW